MAIRRSIGMGQPPGYGTGRADHRASRHDLGGQFNEALTPSLPATNAKRLRKGAKATKQSNFPLCRGMDCFASLAMTVRRASGVSLRRPCRDDPDRRRQQHRVALGERRQRFADRSGRGLTEFFRLALQRAAHRADFERALHRAIETAADRGVQQQRTRLHRRRR